MTARAVWACLAATCCAAAVPATPGRVFIARHGEREDHRRPEWAAHAARAHDSPLSADGKTQAYNLGRHLASTIAPHEDIVVYASPLVRAVQTAHHTLLGMGRAETDVIAVEQCLSETETSLRKRMLGIHTKSVAAKAAGVYSGVCAPILLSPGDLMMAAPNIDLAYESFVQLQHNADGWEVDAAGDNVTMVQRIRSCVAPVIAQARNQGKTVLMFTHGGAARHAVHHLTQGELFKSVSYCQVYELGALQAGSTDRAPPATCIDAACDTPPPPAYTFLQTWHPTLNEGVSAAD